MSNPAPLSIEHQALIDLGHTVTEQQQRIAATVALHDPDPICAAHHQHLSPQHSCAGPLLYRCATCARTSPQPCRTWRTLTGRDTP